jgi:hypothetical protein
MGEEHEGWSLCDISWVTQIEKFYGIKKGRDW